jgi:hypothetical protein
MLSPWNHTTKLPCIHGGREEALEGGRDMEEEMDKGKKKEDMYPIMMEEDQIKKIMVKFGKTHSGIPYQYKMNNKNRAITDREGLVSDE